MTPTPYTEDTLVQQATADYLERQLGWESVYAYNREDFGPDSLLGRASDRDVVLERPLRERMAALNPGLPGAAYDDAVRQIVAVAASQTLVAANREKYALLRDGVPVTYRDGKGARLRRRLRVLDFDEPANNHFLCVRELWLRVDQWREKEATRDAVKVAIHDFLYSEDTGLPTDSYSDDEVTVRTDEIFLHVFRVYPTLPSPYYETSAA